MYIAARALGPGVFVAKIHGSDVEYAVRQQRRYRDLASEGLEASRAVLGPSRDVLDRIVEFVPAVADRRRIVPPGVDTHRFRPVPRRRALREAARLLARDPERPRGRPTGLDATVAQALKQRDGEALDRLGLEYDQEAPDPDAPRRLRSLAEFRGPVIGYLGKLIPEKGVELAVQAMATIPQSRGLIIGFGRFREWLVALSLALDDHDSDAVEWLASASPMQIEPGSAIDGPARTRPTFTGRLDHRYAPLATTAADVLVVPSTLPEAFGMVAAEGAAAGALPVVARHSGLAEVAAALETHVGRPGAFGFDPGPGAVGRLIETVSALVTAPAEERAELRAAVRAFVASEWSWERCAERTLEAATG